MKIAVINGSSKGKSGNTNIMVSAFLKGAEEAGAETVNIFLAEKDIKHCSGCHSCWFKSPGQCVIKDDMMEVLSAVGGANIIVLATPVYFENISGMLKVFMDRMTMTGNPHSRKYVKKESGYIKPIESQSPKMVMISSCGFSDRSEFQVVSLWINRVVSKMHTELVGEIYATQGKLLRSEAEELQPIIAQYIHNLEEAGKEVAINMKISEETNKLLEQFCI